MANEVAAPRRELLSACVAARAVEQGGLLKINKGRGGRVENKTLRSAR